MSSRVEFQLFRTGLRKVGIIYWPAFLPCLTTYALFLTLFAPFRSVLFVFFFCVSRSFFLLHV